MAKKKTRAQQFIEAQLKDPEIAASFAEGLEELRLSVRQAQLREKRKRLPQRKRLKKTFVVPPSGGRLNQRKPG
jgi:hypothetical protein